MECVRAQIIDMKKFLLSILFLILLSSHAFAAAISTLTDNFDDNSISASWTADNSGGGTVLETNQEIEMTSDLNGGSNYFFTATTYDLTGTQVTIKLVDAGNQALNSWAVHFFLYKSGTEALSWRINLGNIKAIYGSWATGTTGATAAYDSNVYKYLKIREASGTTYWDYSTDGLNWTNFYSIANPFAVTVLEWDAAIVSTAEASTTTLKFDDFNILPSAPSTTTTGFIPRNSIWRNTIYK